MIRALHSGDLIRLTFSSLRRLPNQARSRKRIGQESLPLLDLLPVGYWLGMDGRRQTWIQTKGLRVKGLVSAKARGGPKAWEIDYLFLSPELLQEEMDLLHGLTLAAGRCGVDRVFLRLAADSPSLDAVRNAGFHFYAREYLYRLEKGQHGPRVKGEFSANNLHPVSPANEFGVFQLYNSAYPLHIREAEGQTLDEWREAREQGWGGRKVKEYVSLEDGTVAGWVSAARRKKNGCVSLLVRPESSMGPERLLDYAEKLLSRQSTLWCIASEFQAPLARALEERGYKIVEEYNAGLRHVTAKVRRPSLVPIGVK